MNWGWYIGGATVAGVSTLIAKQYNELATGIPSMDRAGIRGRVLLYAALYRVPARVLMAVIHQESKGDPAHYLGDTKATGGPSIGPGQVYRATAVDLGLWTPPDGVDEREAYAELAQDEDLGIRWAAAVLADKLAHAPELATGIRMYNGSGPQAEVYRDNVISFIDSTYGDTSTAAEAAIS